MVYIKVNEDYKVDYVHCMPFDEVHGLGKSKDELLIDGFLVESIPEQPVEIIGKKHELCFTIEKGLYYDSVDRELTDQEKLDQLENQTAEYMVDLDFRISNIELGL